MSLLLLFFRRYLFSSRAGAVIRSMARLCWLATMIGVFSLIVVSSIMNGFNRSIRTKLLSAEPHITVTGEMASLERGRNIVNSIPEVEVHNFARQDVIIRTLDGRFSGGVAKGLSEAALSDFISRITQLRYKQNPASGVESEQAKLNFNEIMMGSDLARDLGVFEGDEVILIPPESLLAPQGETLKFERMRVKLLFTTEFAEVDAKTILFRLHEKPLRFQSDISGVTGFDLRLPRPDDFHQVKEMLQNQLGESVKVESWADRNKALFMALRLEKVAMTTFLGLSILITCFSIITVLVMLISQKRKEIGLMMAIGFSRKNTERLFLTMGILLSGFGLFGGLALGVIVSILIEKYPVDILPDIYYDTSLPSDINFAFVGAVAVGCVLMAFMAAYWPVRLYMRKSPSENLRLFVAE